MPVDELLDFCTQREAEVYVRFEIYSGCMIVRMRKNNHIIETAIPREDVTSGGFGLTIRVILRNMADKLDKGV